MKPLIGWQNQHSSCNHCRLLQLFRNFYHLSVISVIRGRAPEHRQHVRLLKTRPVRLPQKMPPLLNEEEAALDPYLVLQVAVEADEKMIKKAYRQMSLKYHPDKVSSSLVWL